MPNLRGSIRCEFRRYSRAQGSADIGWATRTKRSATRTNCSTTLPAGVRAGRVEVRHAHFDPHGGRRGVRPGRREGYPVEAKCDPLNRMGGAAGRFASRLGWDRVARRDGKTWSARIPFRRAAFATGLLSIGSAIDCRTTRPSGWTSCREICESGDWRADSVGRFASRLSCVEVGNQKKCPKKDTPLTHPGHWPTRSGSTLTPC